jgi:hypothetical protein
MAADSNQKLFSQIADLGRNMNSLTDALKKNTSVTEASNPAAGKIEKKPAPNDAKPNIDNSKGIDNIDNHLKDISKMLESILGDKGKGDTVTNKKENKVKIDEPAPKKSVPNESKKTPDKPGFDISSLIKNIKIPKFEKGGDVTKTGPAIVGEKGPEIVNLSKGTKVLPADESASFIDSNKLNVSKEDKDKKDSEYRYEKGVDKKGYNEFLEIVKPDKPKAGQRYPSDNEIRIIKARLFNDKENSKEDIESELQDYVFNYDREKGEEAGDKEFSDFIKGKSDKTKLDKKDKPEDKGEKESKKGFFSKLGKKDKSKDKEEKDPKAEFYSKLAQEEKEEGEAKDASREDKLSKLEKEGFNTKSDEEPKKDKTEDKEEKASKKGFFSKLFKKDKSKDKDKDKDETPDEKKSPDEKGKTEEKKPGLLSKIGKGALGVAGNVAGNFGPGGALVKAGLGSLKKLDNKKDKDANEPVAQNKKPALVSDVKKLTPVSKKEPIKEKEAPAEIKGTPKTNPSDDKLTGKSQPTDSKKSGDVQNESAGSGTPGLGSDKDIQDIKNALTRIAGLLEGPLTVSAIDKPFRPDSRRI